ncbi:MAG: hypothetical protein ABIA66_01060 [Candidatus Omnitrophota bacterium]
MFAQENDDLEFALDVNSATVALPKIFRPAIDLSGRGFNYDPFWPQGVADKGTLDTWQEDIGFNNIYRMQYNLWEINQLAKNKDLQKKLLANYENIIKKISDSGGIVILNIFGTPAGLGRVLDRKSPVANLKAFKELMKRHIKNLSCDKRYNIWYEVWSAPDLDDFFLGREQDYLNIYRVVAESIKELSAETKIHIPLGGPGASWWFQNFDTNTIVTPERSLIYDLIKFCSHYHLPFNFITWHAYSTSPKIEQDSTIYKKTGIALIRDWLSYFNLDRDMPLIVDEWNYDSGSNVLFGRYEKAFICASYIPARIKNMHDAGLNYQLFYCLEDFKGNKDGVVRNVGVFDFDPESAEYKGSPKCIYSTFRMLSDLGNNMFVSPSKLKDEFVGVIAAKEPGKITILIYNYIDPELGKNYISSNIVGLKNAERKILVNLNKSDKLTKIMRHELDISAIRLTKRLKNLLKKALELNDRAEKFKSSPRNIKINIKNLKDTYLFQLYTIDSGCSVNCSYKPVQEKEISASGAYQETLTLSPYSVNMIVLKNKPKEAQPEVAPQVESGQPANQTVENQ